MQGQDGLIAMRIEGVRPPVVRIEVQNERQWSLANNCGHDHYELTVSPMESIDRLDLRCVIGLDVVIASEDFNQAARTVRALGAACVLAGAERVVGIEYSRGSAETISESTKVIFEHGVPH
jgi:hypothetical protein